MKITTTTLCLALALGPGQAFALEQCTPQLISQSEIDMIKSEIFTGLTPADISSMLGCSGSSSNAGSTVTWSARDTSVLHEIVVSFSAEGKATQATFRDVPITAGVGAGSDNSGNTAASAAVLIGAAALASSFSSGGIDTSAGADLAPCTPATINSGTIYAMHPYMSKTEVFALLGCAPTLVSHASWIPFPQFEQLEQSPGAMGYLFSAGLGLGQLGMVFAAIDDVHGLLWALYWAPGGVYGVGGMVLINPVRWQIDHVDIPAIP